jgi:hypothetical protein
MKFMLEFPSYHESRLYRAKPEHLREGLRRFQEALQDGSFDAAYTKVGGGGYIIVNSSDTATLTRILRKYLVHDVNVVPILETTQVIQGYIDHHETEGAHEAHKQEVMEFLNLVE